MRFCDERAVSEAKQSIGDKVVIFYTCGMNFFPHQRQWGSRISADESETIVHLWMDPARTSLRLNSRRKFCRVHTFRAPTIGAMIIISG